MESGLWNCRRWRRGSLRWRPGPQPAAAVATAVAQFPSPASAQSGRWTPWCVAESPRSTRLCGSGSLASLHHKTGRNTFTASGLESVCLLTAPFLRESRSFRYVLCFLWVLFGRPTMLPSRVLPFRVVVGCGSVIRLALSTQSIHIFTVREVLQLLKNLHEPEDNFL